MKFGKLLQTLSSSDFWQSRARFCFQAQSYSYHFFQLLFQHLITKQFIPQQPKRMSLENSNGDALYSVLGQSMLGQTNHYWLGDLSLMKKGKHKKKAISFLLDYQGPHQVSVFINKDEELTTAQKKNALSIPDNFTHNDFIEFMDFLEIPLPEKKYTLIKELFNKVSDLPINFACVLIIHLELISVKDINELISYLTKQLEEQPSLYQLSEYFFSRNPKSFFKLWCTLEKDYSTMFWLAYWSDQLWKAFHTKRFLEQKTFAQAKRMSYRLPHSFLSKTWKLTRKQDLLDLYTKLYEIDFSVKKGITFSGALDLWYCKHFLNSN